MELLLWAMPRAVSVSPHRRCCNARTTATIQEDRGVAPGSPRRPINSLLIPLISAGATRRLAARCAVGWARAIRGGTMRKNSVFAAPLGLPLLATSTPAQAPGAALGGGREARPPGPG